MFHQVMRIVIPMQGSAALIGRPTKDTAPEVYADAKSAEGAAPLEHHGQDQAQPARKKQRSGMSCFDCYVLSFVYPGAKLDHLRSVLHGSCSLVLDHSIGFWTMWLGGMGILPMRWLIDCKGQGRCSHHAGDRVICITCEAFSILQISSASISLYL